MNNDEGKIWYGLGIRNDQLQRDAQKSSSIFRGIGDNVESEGSRIDNIFKNIAKGAATAFSIQAAMQFTKSVVQVRGEMEALEISLETLLGSKAKSAKMISEIADYAANTPLQLGDIAKGATTMLAFNLEAEKILPTLKQIGDISMGDAQKFASLTLAFSQMSSTGRLMGQDLLQMINAGFNPLTIISEKTGKTISSLKKEMEAGAISSEMVAQAFADATSAGGKFNGMLQKQSEGIKGSISNFEGAVDEALNNIGSKNQDLITSSIQGATLLVQNYEKVGRAALDLAVAVGSYKAALIAVNAIQRANIMVLRQAVMEKWLAAAAGINLSNAEAIAAARTKLFTIAQKGLATSLKATASAMLANPYVLAAAAIAAVAFVTYKAITADSEYEKAIKKVNKALEDTQKAKDDAGSNVDQYINTIRSETSSILEQVRAYDALIKRYTFFANYSFEDLKKLSPSQLAGVLSQFSTEMEKGMIQSLIKQAEADIESEVSVYRTRAKREGYTFDESSVSSVKVLRQQISMYKKQLEEIDKAEHLAKVKALPIEAQKEYYESELSSIKKVKESIEAIHPDNRSVLQVEQLDMANAQLRETESILAGMSTKGGSSLGQLISDIAKGEKELAELRKKAGAGEITTTAVEEKVTALEALKKQYELMTGKEYGKVDKAALEEQKNALKELTKQQAEFRLKSDIELQGRILALQSDTFEKQRQQAENEFEIEKVDIERRRQEAYELLAKSKGVEVAKLTDTDKVGVNEQYDKELENAQKVKSATIVKINTEASKTLRELWSDATDANISDGIREVKAINANYDEIVKKAKDAGATLKEIDDINAERNKALHSAFTRQELDKIAIWQETEALLAEGSTAFLDKQTEVRRKLAKIDIEASKKRVEALKKEQKETGKDNSALIKREEAFQDNTNKNLENLKNNYLAIGELLGDTLSQSSDEFVAKLGGLLSSISSSIGQIQNSDSAFGKASGIVGLAMAAGNYLKGIRIDRENENLNKQKKITGEVADRVKLENEINKLYDERRDALNENLFLGKDYGKVMSNAMSDILKYNEKLGVTLGDLYSNAIFTADGEAKRLLFGTKKGEYSFSLQDLLAGMVPKEEGAKGLGEAIANTLNHGLNEARKRIKDGDFLGAVGSILDPLQLFGGGKADSKARTNAFENLGNAVQDTLKVMGKTTADFATMSTQDLLDFFTLMEKAGNITDEATKKLLAAAQEQLEMVKKAEEQMKEVISELTGGLGDAIRDILTEGFRGGFGYGVNEAKKVATEISGILENMISRELMNIAFSGMFNTLKENMQASFGADGDKSWADDFAQFMESFPAAAEQFNKGMAEAKKSGEKYGLDLFGDSSSRSATAKGIASASQDSIDDLNGRATTIQGHTFSISNDMKKLVNFMSQILEHVAGIKKDTSRLEKIEKEITSVKNGIESINTKGITIKY
ncbi:MAG: tape measure protein [Bacteroidales bacterium]|nr:tape measure protein [Bacteroidales bacterium]